MMQKHPGGWEQIFNELILSPCKSFDMRKLSALLAFATTTLISLSAAMPASASIVEFAVIESAGPGGIGQYTVINNSDEAGYAPEYIYAFSVTNPLASSVKDWTTEKGWIAG